VGSDIKKFVNPKFLKTIDLGLMRELFDRHFGGGELPVAFDGEAAEVRSALANYFAAPVTDWSEGMIRSAQGGRTRHRRGNAAHPERRATTECHPLSRSGH